MVFLVWYWFKSQCVSLAYCGPTEADSLGSLTRWKMSQG